MQSEVQSNINPKKSKLKKVNINARRENLYGWAFLSLNLIGYIMFKLLPIIISFILSFCDWNLISGIGGIKFTGIENYKVMWSDEWFIKSLINTLYFAFVSVPFAIVLSLLVAVILNGKIYLKSLIRLNFYIPNIASMVAISVIWAILYLPSYGPINMFLRSIGISNPPGWISSSAYAMPSLIVMGIWQVIGYNVIILLAGLQAIPSTYYESADIDGANSVSKLFHITIPLLSPTLFFLLIISIMHSFRVFTQVNVMTQGGPGTSTTVLVYYIYKTAFTFNRLGYANSISWILFIIVFIVTAFQWKIQKKWVHV